MFAARRGQVVSRSSGPEARPTHSRVDRWWWYVSGERYRVLWIGQVAVVTLPAEIDVTNAEAIREELLAVLNQGAVLLVADMSRTAFCDSSGVSALVRVFRHYAGCPAGALDNRGRPAGGRISQRRRVAGRPERPGGPGLAGRCHGQGRYRRRRLGPAFLERRRRLRRLAGHAGHHRAGYIPEFYIAVLRGGPQDRERAGLIAILPGHNYPERLINDRSRSQG